jgi:hypothetical protein
VAAQFIIILADVAHVRFALRRLLFRLNCFLRVVIKAYFIIRLTQLVDY